MAPLSLAIECSLVDLFSFDLSSLETLLQLLPSHHQLKDTVVMDRSLVEFYRKFKQQIDPPGIPSGTVLKHPDVQRALENRFFNIKAESLSAYQARILRVVIERTQNAITDPEEEVSHEMLQLSICKSEYSRLTN